MIDAKCFTREWLDECSRQAGRIDPGLLEKSIYAFELLGRLAESGLPFVFKGGTALLLVLDRFRRLSIDVDIACAASQEEVKRIVAEVLRESRFSGFEQDMRDSTRLPKRHHYAINYDSVVNSQPATLQLDVLEDEAHYPHTQRLPLHSRFVLPAREVFITVPTVEGLLADKLTAYAPKTVGVKYEAYKASIKIAKQIADIGELFGWAKDGRDFVEAYQRMFDAENGYRNNAFSLEQALDDTIQSASLFSSIDLKGYVAGPESAILILGVAQVDSHMIGPRYSRGEAKIAAARAAHLAALLRAGKVPDDMSAIRYDASAIETIKGAKLDGEFTILNRLKSINPEAFFHWVRVQDALR